MGARTRSRGPSHPAPDVPTRPGGGEHGLRGLPALLRGRALRRLLAVRVLSQAGDGAFQLGLAGLLLFSPERATTVGTTAALFALTLLPYTLVGPFAGTVLDRWRRRQVLLAANVVRAVLVAGVAALVLVDASGGGSIGGSGGSSGSALAGSPAELLLLAAVLLCLSANRFFLAGLGAALPHVVAPRDLVLANAVTPTVGTLAVGVGAGVAFAVRAVAGAGTATDAVLVLLAGGLYLLSSAAVCLLGRDALGRGTDGYPRDEAHGTGPLASAWRVVVDAARGVRHLRARPAAARGLAAVGVHRFVYGVLLVDAVLLTRNTFADPADPAAGLQLLGLVIGATTAGIAVAVAVTPSASARWGTHRWSVLCLAVAAATTTVVGAHLTLAVLVAGAFCLGAAGQSLKICTDAVVQRDVEPDQRGRAFSVYDTVFNAAFVLAAVVAALVLPDDGVSRATLLVLAALYAATAVVLGDPRRHDAPAGTSTT